MKIPSIPADKAQHFTYGALIALLALYSAIFLGLDQWAAKLIGVVAAISAGLIKEYVLDLRANKTAEAAGSPLPHEISAGDVIATVLGGVVVWLA